MNDYLNAPVLQLWIRLLTQACATLDVHAKLLSQLLQLHGRGGRDLRIADGLHDAASVSHIYKYNAAVISRRIHPSTQPHKAETIARVFF